MSTKELSSKNRPRRRSASRRRAQPFVAADPGRAMMVEGIDMVEAIGRDFGCVKSGDTRAVQEKLADFGRAQHR